MAMIQIEEEQGDMSHAITNEQIEKEKWKKIIRTENEKKVGIINLPRHLTKEVADDEKIELSGKGRKIMHKLNNRNKGTEGIFETYLQQNQEDLTEGLAQERLRMKFQENFIFKNSTKPKFEQDF